MHGKDDDDVVNRSKIDGVRKSSEHRSPDCPVYSGERRRILYDSRHGVLQSFYELVSEAGASALVPTPRIRRLSRGFGPKLDGPCHRPPRS